MIQPISYNTICIAFLILFELSFYVFKHSTVPLWGGIGEYTRYCLSLGIKSHSSNPVLFSVSQGLEACKLYSQLEVSWIWPVEIPVIDQKQEEGRHDYVSNISRCKSWDCEYQDHQQFLPWQQGGSSLARMAVPPASFVSSVPMAGGWPLSSLN